MPRYHFNIVSDQGPIATDPEGQELPSIEDARQLALGDIHEIVHKPKTYGNNWDRRSFDITDEDGRSVLTVPFA